MEQTTRHRLLKTLGPGILFASTAIGVSHLVQSTRAGAVYGLGLIWVVVLANLFKYPFFEFGSRYANIKGQSIIDGYHEIGTWMLWIYSLVTFGSMFFVMAAVGAVTAGFLDNLFGIGHLKFVTIGLFVFCMFILILGKYKVLDSLIKVIASVLLLSTLAAFLLTLVKGPSASLSGSFQSFEWNEAGIAFVIALMGWMPTAVDLSAWNSLWTLERIKQTGYRPTLKETLFDFNLGYVISAVLSLCFLTLGAYLIFGTGEIMPNGSASFANSVVQLYTSTIGQWSYFVIASAAFSIMLGTCIAVFDGYSRAMERSLELIVSPSQPTQESGSRRFYVMVLATLGIGAFGVIYFMLFWKSDTGGFKALIDLATTISFLIAPLIAIVNYRLVTNKSFPKDAQPRLWLHILSWLGIMFLLSFSLFYLFVNFLQSSS